MKAEKSKTFCRAWAVYFSGVDVPICISAHRSDIDLFLSTIPSSPVKRRLSVRRVEISLSDSVKSR